MSHEVGSNHTGTFIDAHVFSKTFKAELEMFPSTTAISACRKAFVAASPGIVYKLSLSTSLKLKMTTWPPATTYEVIKDIHICHSNIKIAVLAEYCNVRGARGVWDALNAFSGHTDVSAVLDQLLSDRVASYGRNEERRSFQSMQRFGHVSSDT